MNHDQWKEDMHDGVDAAHKNHEKEMLMLSIDTPGIGKTYMGAAPFVPLTVTEMTRLHKSINATSDPDRMKDDTIFRTNGVCGVNKAERINGISESVHQLNMGLDGG